MCVVRVSGPGRGLDNRLRAQATDAYGGAVLGRVHHLPGRCGPVPSGGYPEDYEKNKVITGLDKTKDSIVFHAGTKNENGNVVTNGGRVIAITSFGDTIEEAVTKSFKNAEIISYDKKYYRKDIGKDLMKLEKVK